MYSTNAESKSINVAVADDYPCTGSAELRAHVAANRAQVILLGCERAREAYLRVFAG